MRMAAATAALVLAVEALIALGFVAGWHWIGGLRGGLAGGGVVLLLLVLPWAGELQMRFDSAGPAVAVRMSWWGRLSFRDTPTATLTCFRLLGIPIRRKRLKDQSPPEAPPEATDTDLSQQDPDSVAPTSGVASSSINGGTEAAGFLRTLDRKNVEAGSRLILSGLTAANDLLWSAREITVRLDDLAEHALTDRALKRIFGARSIGPLTLLVMTGEGARRIRLRLRISMARVVVNALHVLVEGQPHRLRARKTKKPSDESRDTEDRELIQAILDAREDE